MSNDIKLQYNHRERDLEVKWNAGHKPTALYMLGVFDREVQEELERRGYDIATLKFSISKRGEAK
jgi:hypothetical protein